MRSLKRSKRMSLAPPTLGLSIKSGQVTGALAKSTIMRHSEFSIRPDDESRYRERNTMRSFFIHALAIGIFFGAVLIALPGRPLAAADDKPAVRQADRLLAEAL